MCEETLVLKLISIANGGNVSGVDLDVDWDRVLALSCLQGVVGLVFDGLQVLVKEVGREKVPQDFVIQLYAKKMRMIRAMQNRKQVISRFAAELKAHDQSLDGVVLKGVDYAQYWRNPFYREYFDLDCLYDNVDEVNRWAPQIGANVHKSTHKHTHIFYKGMMIENHQALTDYDGSKIGRQTENVLQGLLHEEPALPLADTGLLSPNPLFTACFMLKHAQMHFMTEGIKLRHFLDWMYFMQKCGDKLDLARLDELLVQMRLRNFAAMVVAFCNKNLGGELRFLADGNVDDRLLRRVSAFVFEGIADLTDKNWISRARRFGKRFYRAWHFRHLHYLPYHQALWTWIAYASTLNRKPKGSIEKM